MAKENLIFPSRGIRAFMYIYTRRAVRIVYSGGAEVYNKKEIREKKTRLQCRQII